jgi:hypothetical protein
VFEEWCGVAIYACVGCLVCARRLWQLLVFIVLRGLELGFSDIRVVILRFGFVIFICVSCFD